MGRGLFHNPYPKRAESRFFSQKFWDLLHTLTRYDTQQPNHQAKRDKKILQPRFNPDQNSFRPNAIHCPLAKSRLMPSFKNIHNSGLPQLSHCRNLGVVISSDRSCSLHIQQICVKDHHRANSILHCFVTGNVTNFIHIHIHLFDNKGPTGL